MRAAIGLFAVVLLIVGFFTRHQVDDAISGACVRVGLMMGIWWFAYPQLQNVPRWLAVTGGLLLLVVMLRPKLLIFAVPVVIVLWILRPRSLRRAVSRPRDQA
jgi:hypothetical protein